MQKKMAFIYIYCGKNSGNRKIFITFVAHFINNFNDKAKIIRLHNRIFSADHAQP